MPQHCVVRFCATTQSSKTGTSLHRFPKDPILRAKWINFVRFGRQNWTPCVSSAICSLHFTTEDSVGVLMKKFGCRTRVFLKPGAVPTIQPSLPGRTVEEGLKKFESRKKEKTPNTDNQNQISYQQLIHSDAQFKTKKRTLVSNDPPNLKPMKRMEWLLIHNSKLEKTRNLSSPAKMVR